MLHRRAVAIVILVAGLALSGCAATGSSLRPIAGNALAAARSAELGIRLNEGGGMIPTTQRVLLGDMAGQLGDTVRELELAQTADAAAERMRRKVLDASRAALDAIHLAQRGKERRAEERLHAAAADLARLAGMK